MKNSQISSIKVGKKRRSVLVGCKTKTEGMRIYLWERGRPLLSKSISSSNSSTMQCTCRPKYQSGSLWWLQSTKFGSKSMQPKRQPKQLWLVQLRVTQWEEASISSPATQGTTSLSNTDSHNHSFSQGNHNSLNISNLKRVEVDIRAIKTLSLVGIANKVIWETSTHASRP